MGEVSSALSLSRKGSAQTIRGMNTTDTAREARSRNLARLRRLTIGTAAISVAATSGFGFLAAATYTGATTSGATAYTTSSTASTSSTTTTAATTTTANAAPAVTSTSGSSHVSSGGS
jgi:hypothetical protein